MNERVGSVSGGQVCADFSAMELMEELQAFCVAKGLNGLKGLACLFRRMDCNHDQTISWAEFRLAMVQYQFSNDAVKLRALFDAFDKDHNLSIDFVEFLEELRPPLSTHRLIVLDSIWRQIDVNDDGVISVEEIMGR